jgi:hypothetical protein
MAENSPNLATLMRLHNYITFSVALDGGVAQWSSHPLDEQKIRVQISAG